MPWTNPAAQRCRAELALHVSVRVFERFHRAALPAKAFNEQLTRCLRWHYECTKALPGRRIPAEMWAVTKKRLALLDPLFKTNHAKNQEAAAEQWCVLAGCAAMLIADVVISCPDYHTRAWRYLSDTTDTLFLRYLTPLFPDAEAAAAKLWQKVSA